MDSSIKTSIFSTASIVSNYVSAKTNQVEDLRRLYDNAFKEWALEMRRLQKARTLDPWNLSEEECKSEAAETAYRTARDRLAEALGAAAAMASNNARRASGFSDSVSP
jgi:hypothetical protein